MKGQRNEYQYSHVTIPGTTHYTFFLKRSNSSFRINGRRFEQLLQYQVRHGISHGKHVFLYVITENF